MFWIGLIVGIIIAAVLPFGYLMWCMYCTGTSFREFGAMTMCNAYAVTNRESAVQVWHDGELIDEVVLEEK